VSDTPTDPGWVVVSGGGGALGSKLATHYAAKGRSVLALDRELARLSGSGPGGGLVARQIDLLTEETLDECLAQTIPAMAPINLLVNAVGAIRNEPVLALRGAKIAVHGLHTWREVIDSNLTAPFAVATRVAARMARRGGGSIVNFSSIASSGNPGQAAYSAAKAGIEGMTRAMASELGPLRIRVNALALGFIDVETTHHSLSDTQLRAYAGRTPLGRLGRLEDVVSAVEFLETNSFVNGEVIRVDGGLRL
jgi:3-oxoacyl-[acyl-carrier protein] reductase